MIETTAYRLAPTIPGLVFRHLRAPDDYRPMNVIANAVRAAEGEDWATSAEQFQRFYEHLSNCDLAADIVLVERGGTLIGYGRTWWFEELDGQRVYEPISFLDPTVAVDGLFRAMHQTMEERAREIAAGHPAGPKVLQGSAAGSATERDALLRESGYEPVRYGYAMIRPTLDDLPGMPLPDGLEIREVQDGDVRTIWEADVEAFRDHWGAGVPTDEDYQQFIHDPIQNDTALWRVAWDGDQVAGMVRSFINAEENERYRRQRGYVENISVRRPWRRRGLARALIAASLPLLRARGMTEGALGVDTENPNGALRVYESCGFVAVRRDTTYRKRFE